MKIYKKDDKVIVKLDYWQHKNNPYSEEEEKELTHNLIGVICGDEQGIAQNIDLSYKDTQQIGEIIIKTNLERKIFIKLCQDLEIEFYEYPICDYCKKVLYGCFTYGKKGPMCFECELKNKE